MSKELNRIVAEEVCEVLGMFFKKKVIYLENENLFYIEKFSNKFGNYEDVICFKKENGEISISIDLPSHLVVLIGKFYERFVE